MAERCAFIFIILIICLHRIVDGQHECTGNITGNTCVEFQGTFVRRTWSTAAQTCIDQGGYLVGIPDSDRQNFLEELAAEESLGDFWIGLQDLRTKLWGWTTEEVPTEAILLGQGCYTDTAQQRDLPTRANISSLLTPQLCIDACAALDFLYAGTQTGEECWCGNDFANYGNTLTTGCTTTCRGSNAKCGGINKNFIYRTDGVYGEWKENQPNDFDGKQNCGAMDANGEYKLADETCDNAYHFICDLPDISAVDCDEIDQDGFMITDNVTCFYLGDVAVTWFAAQQECWARNGTLLKLTSATQRLALEQLIEARHTNRQKMYYWTALQRRQLTWQNGAVMTYSNWEPNSPDETTDECFKASSQNGYSWQDVSCSTTLAFFCEFEIPPSTTVSDTTTDNPSTVPMTTLPETTIPMTTVSMSTIPVESTTLPATTSEEDTTSYETTTMDVTVVTTAVAMETTDSSPAPSSEAPTTEYIPTTTAAPTTMMMSTDEPTTMMSPDEPTTMISTNETTTMMTTNEPTTMMSSEYDTTAYSNLSDLTTAAEFSTSETESSIPITTPEDTGSTSGVEPPPTGQASTDNDDNNRTLFIVLIVLVSALIVIVIIATIIFVALRKTNKSPVHPSREVHYDREPEKSAQYHSAEENGSANHDISYTTWMNTNVPTRSARAKYHNGRNNDPDIT